MPRKSKAAAPSPQVRPSPPKLLELRPPKISDTVAEEMRRALQAMQRSPLLQSVAATLRQLGERSRVSELSKQLGEPRPPVDFRRWLGRSAEPAEQTKKTVWRAKIDLPRTFEAIDQMLRERESDPSLGLVKAQVNRVVAILEKKHVRVADSQRRTLQRMIKERAALKRQSDRG
jgi:hypothetical protein